jgi:polyhydroxyalkanoate synthase
MAEIWTTSQHHLTQAETQAALIEGEAAPLSERDELERAFVDIDRIFRAGLAKSFLGLSPAAIAEAQLDWGMHFSASPGKQMWLLWKAWRKALRLHAFLVRSAASPGPIEPCIEPLPHDRRFDDPGWQSWPFNVVQQSFLLWQQWLSNAVTDTRGVSPAHERILEFSSRQLLDMVAPSNFLWSNPVVLARTFAESGFNLARGAGYFLEDFEKAVLPTKPSPPNPALGVRVAITPGRVVFRNRLIELIQYEPSTGTTYPEPVLFVPAWIMKYYILDLSPHNSLVRYLVGQGFTVFMISWRNPGAEDRNLGMADYLELGVMAAIREACTITGRPSLHATGYCLGGTLLSIAAAAMARDGDERLRSISLFAAQQDFHEAGELTLFINSSEVALLEDMMWQNGFLEATQMAGAFQMLRSNDLIWSSVIQNYLLGERAAQTDLMAWNADSTRLPARMHSEYLRGLFLNNDLAEGRFRVGGAVVAMSDIRAPIFALGTLTDHVAPWQSVHKVHLLTETEVTFVLTSGGHNAGIVSEPGHRGRTYKIRTRKANALYLSPSEWLIDATPEAGSWWPAWVSWLRDRSGQRAEPPAMGESEVDLPGGSAAPGHYVQELRDT